MNAGRHQTAGIMHYNVRYFIILSIFMCMTASVLIYTVLHITEVVLFGWWFTVVK